MELVLVERRFAEPVSFEEIQALETAGAWCLQSYNVRFLQTLFSRDRKRMLCLYEAPDAEAVRLAESQAEVPYDRAWTCQRLKPEKPVPGTLPAEYVVVEREFPSAVTTEFAQERYRESSWCFDTYRAIHLESFLAIDGLNMVCVFRAPDAEAVRMANAKGGARFSDLWTASFHQG